MSKATKKKHVIREVIEDEVKPTGDQAIVRVTGGRGNNLHEVEACDGSKFLVSMPTKFRKSVWIKRGDYVIVEPIVEGNKVQAEIVHILYPMQIKSLKQQNLWPLKFSSESAPEASNAVSQPPPPTHAAAPGNQPESPGGSESSDNDDDLFENTNRPPPLPMGSCSSEESD